MLAQLDLAARELGLVGGDSRLDQGQLAHHLRELGGVAHELLRELLDLCLALRGQLEQARALAALVRAAALERLDRRAYGVELLAQELELLLALHVAAPRGLEIRVARRHARFQRDRFAARGLERALRLPQGRGIGGEALAGHDQLEVAELRAQLLEAGRPPRLAVERADLALQLAQDVAHAHQVLLGRLQLALGLLAALPVLPDPGGLLEDHAPVLGPRRHQLRDVPLLDDRVAARADARVEEEVADVAQAARRLVDQVLALARAVEASPDLDLAEAGVGLRCPAVGVVEREDDLGHRDGSALLGAGEDQVFHRATAQVARVLLAHHPAQRVDDVRLAAAVRPDDAGDAPVERRGRSGPRTT